MTPWSLASLKLFSSILHYKLCNSDHNLLTVHQLSYSYRSGSLVTIPLGFSNNCLLCKLESTPNLGLDWWYSPERPSLSLLDNLLGFPCKSLGLINLFKIQYLLALLGSWTVVWEIIKPHWLVSSDSCYSNSNGSSLLVDNSCIHPFGLLCIYIFLLSPKILNLNPSPAFSLSAGDFIS